MLDEQGRAVIGIVWETSDGTAIRVRPFAWSKNRKPVGPIPTSPLDVAYPAAAIGGTPPCLPQQTPADPDRDDDLVARLLHSLRSTGSAHAAPAELHSESEVAQWRSAARRAAHQLKRPVETVAGDGGAWAALRDWPATEDEQTKHRQQMRRAVEAASPTSQAPARRLDPTRARYLKDIKAYKAGLVSSLWP